MPIWKLTPDEKKLTEPNWEASTRKSEITIEAANEDEARKKAIMSYWIAVKRAPDGTIPIGCPWGSSDLVRCERLEDSEDPGDEIIIEAANIDEARKKVKMLYGRAAKRAPDRFYPIVSWESSSLVWCGRSPRSP